MGTIKKRFLIAIALFIMSSFQASQTGASTPNTPEDGCVLRVPTVVVNPAQTTALPGSTLNYFASVKNNNSPECSPSEFYLNDDSYPIDGRQFFKFTFDTQKFYLNSGQKEVFSFSLKVSPEVPVDQNFVFAVSSFIPGTHFKGFDYLVYRSAKPPRPDVCTQKAPTLMVSPATGGGPPGSTTKFTVVMKNNNSNLCDPVPFDLSSFPYPYLKLRFLPSTVRIASGKFGEATLEVTSERPPTGEACVETEITLEARNGFDATLVDRVKIRHQIKNNI